MQKNFWTLLLATGYSIVFVALVFILIGDNFSAYKDFGKLTYFAFVPVGFFAICALSIYALLAFSRFLTQKTTASIAIGLIASPIIFWIYSGNPFTSGIHREFLLFMRIDFAVFIAGTPTIFFACAMSLTMAARVRRAWIMFGLTALVFIYLCVQDIALLSICTCASIAVTFTIISLWQWWRKICDMKP